MDYVTLLGLILNVGIRRASNQRLTSIFYRGRISNETLEH
jgi:hypothetical protein